MDNLKSAAQAFAALSFKDRLPAWKEYETGSPAEQRAIMERWLEIKTNEAPKTLYADWDIWTAAYGRWCRAYALQNPIQYKPQTQWWHEDYIQGDYEPSGISDLTKGDLGA